MYSLNKVKALKKNFGAFLHIRKECMLMRELVDHIEGINRLMARYGVKFGIYKNGEFRMSIWIL